MTPQWGRIWGTAGVVLGIYLLCRINGAIDTVVASKGIAILEYFSRIADVGSESASFKEEMQGTIAFAMLLLPVVALLKLMLIRARQREDD